MVVKRNRRQLYDELTWFFSTPPAPCDRPWRAVTTVNKGHGRLETRTLTCTDDLDDYLLWPGVQQVLRRETERIALKTGEVTRAVTYGVTSLTAADATPEQLAGLVAGALDHRKSAALCAGCDAGGRCVSHACRGGAASARNRAQRGH
jgi:hypothetical protein